MKRKILIITAGFFPGINYGGPPVSVDNFCSLFGEYKIYIVACDHDNKSKTRYENITKGWNDRGNCKVLYLSDRQYKYVNFLRICRKINPDWIYLQGLFQSCIIPSLLIAKKEGVKTLLATRGELCAGAFKKKAKKIPYVFFLKAFGLFEGIEFQSTSPEETAVIQYWLQVGKKHVHYLPNIPTMPNASHESTGVKRVGKAKMVFISRIVPKKNLMYALKRLQSTRGEVVFDIYGLVEDKEYWTRCKRVIKNLPKNVNVNYCGVIEHDQVMDTFSEYDAFLFPTLSENYGHVIVESLLSGCPVIISNATPWRDLRKFNAGWDIDLKNERQFEDAINAIVYANNVEIHQIRTSAKEYINNKLEIKKIKEAYKKLFDGF